jgi:hypothetical protein
VLALLALSFTLATVSGAKPKSAPDRVVFPTGEWPTDVQNVQAAVDLGGTILLKATDVAGLGAIVGVRRLEGSVRIADNFISPSLELPGGGLGIYIFENDLWDDIRASSPVYQVVGNRVLNQNADTGIAFVRPQGLPILAPVIERNHITVHGSLAGITFGGNVSNARVSNNRIDGDALVGLEIFTYEPSQSAESNRFLDNNLKKFEAGTADLFLDTHTRNTVAKGRFDTVIDLGTGNRITGAKKCRSR